MCSIDVLIPGFVLHCCAARGCLLWRLCVPTYVCWVRETMIPKHGKGKTCEKHKKTKQNETPENTKVRHTAPKCMGKQVKLSGNAPTFTGAATRVPPREMVTSPRFCGAHRCHKALRPGHTVFTHQKRTCSTTPSR